jgi:predicted alpha-1,6-mannanase (GH76 family)
MHTWPRRACCRVRAAESPGRVVATSARYRAVIPAYRALVATTLPGDSAADAQARDTARRIVLSSARSAWDNRQTVDGLPLFGAFWDREAELPAQVPAAGHEAQFVEGAVNASRIAERDLSVQLSGWMLMEAAGTVSTVAEAKEP